MCGLERTVELHFCRESAVRPPLRNARTFPLAAELKAKRRTNMNGRSYPIEAVMLSGVSPIGRVPVAVSHLYLNEAADW